MAIRTTVDDVKDILDNTNLEDSVIEAFIGDANIFVTGHLSGEGLGDDTLEMIEKWIAAHMISITRERTYSDAEAGGAKVKYTGKWGERLKATSYGQMAIDLDTSNTLLKLAESKKEASSRAVESFDD